MKIPCIKCNEEMWEYIRPYLISWGYIDHTYPNWTTYYVLVINDAGDLGICNNYNRDNRLDYNREVVTDVEEFLKRAAELKGFTYKREEIMNINGVEIKPGMVIITKDNVPYIAFPTHMGMAFTNNITGGWTLDIPCNITFIRDLARDGSLYSGKILWEKPKEVVLTMDQIAKKFGVPVEQIKIKK